MCAEDLTEVHSPALCNERSMQLGMSTGWPKEVNSVVQTPRSGNPASANSLRACRQRFQTLEKNIQFTKICEDATFADKSHGGCECSLASVSRADPEGAQFRPWHQQSCIVCDIWNGTSDCSFTVTTSWWRCPIVRKSGSKRSSLEIQWNMHGEVPFGWRHFDGNFVLEPCDQMGSRTWWRRIGG